MNILREETVAFGVGRMRWRADYTSGLDEPDGLLGRKEAVACRRAEAHGRATEAEFHDCQTGHALGVRDRAAQNLVFRASARTASAD
jgi:hypothetical protein